MIVGAPATFSGKDATITFGMLDLVNLGLGDLQASAEHRGYRGEFQCAHGSLRLGQKPELRRIGELRTRKQIK